MTINKQYLGDGVYVSFDGYQLKLTTEDGIETTNTIYLEPSVFNALYAYALRIRTADPAPPAEQEAQR